MTQIEEQTLLTANNIATRYGLKAEYLLGQDGNPIRKICVVGDDRKYNPVCVLSGEISSQETLAEVSLEISNQVDLTCTYDITNLKLRTKPSAVEKAGEHE